MGTGADDGAGCCFQTGRMRDSPTPPANPAEPLLRLQNITKYYPGVVALRDVTLSLAPAEILGLIGENGAGKSTLMKILGGVVPPTSGTISIGGQDHAALTVAQSIAAGVAFVHQELNLFDNLDVAANVYIGREPLTGGLLRFVDSRRMERDVRPILDLLGADFGPTTPVASLSIAQRQILEIAKALSLKSKAVVLDEPTSSLTLAETSRLLRVVRSLKESGVSVIFISHRLNEIKECADRVVILRDGVTVGELRGSGITHQAMIEGMIGRDLKSLYQPPAASSDEDIMRLEDFVTAAHPTKRINLSVRRGEILGVAGLIGAGRSEMARAMFGIDRCVSGNLVVGGTPLHARNTAEAMRHGVFLVPEDRKAAGVILDLSVEDNIALPNLHRLSRFGMADSGQVREVAEEMKERLNIRAPNVEVGTGSLSGGNQQKVVLAKWLAMGPKVLICDEPTRGIDVGAKQEIYRMLRALADRGIAVIMISSDMEEVIGVSDRIAVMHEGTIAGILQRQDFSERNVMRLAVGAAPE
jgi:ribose transport system ATP-binding protein